MQRLFCARSAPFGAAVIGATATARRFAGNGGYIKFDPEDPMLMQDQLTEEEKQIERVAREFAQKTLKPRVQMAYREERADRDIFYELGELGPLGATIEGYGCSGVSHTANGLIACEIERVDSGYRSAWSVQSSLAMYPISRFGSEE